MYSADMRDAQLILGYSDVFSGEKPNLIERIKKLNMHKAKYFRGLLSGSDPMKYT